MAADIGLSSVAFTHDSSLPSTLRTMATINYHTSLQVFHKRLSKTIHGCIFLTLTITILESNHYSAGCDSRESNDRSDRRHHSPSCTFILKTCLSVWLYQIFCHQNRPSPLLFVMSVMLERKALFSYHNDASWLRPTVVEIILYRWVSCRTLKLNIWEIFLP